MLKKPENLNELFAKVMLENKNLYDENSSLRAELTIAKQQITGYRFLSPQVIRFAANRLSPDSSVLIDMNKMEQDFFAQVDKTK